MAGETGGVVEGAKSEAKGKRREERKEREGERRKERERKRKRKRGCEVMHFNPAILPLKNALIFPRKSLFFRVKIYQIRG